MATEESNNGLYFIVGGLLVVAIVIAIMVAAPDTFQNRMNETTPAAGEVSTSSTTNETSTSYDPGDNSVTRTERTQTTTSD